MRMYVCPYMVQRINAQADDKNKPANRQCIWKLSVQAEIHLNSPKGRKIKVHTYPNVNLQTYVDVFT